MVETYFMKLYEALSEINDDKEETLSEARYSDASPINLADCRMINSDVVDSRGELEASACLYYNGELTRVQVRTVITRDTPNGKEFLGKYSGTRVRIPGGGYDMNKDSDLLDAAVREAYEEFNLVLHNVKDTGIAVWSHRNDTWVTKHVAAEEDRWTGYYTHYVIADVAGEGDNANPDEANRWHWLPIEEIDLVNKKLASLVNTLNEAIHPDKEGRADLGEISYLCDSTSTLRKILSRMEIQKTYVPEVRYEVGEHNGNTQRIKQMSLSTSTDLTGHAQRRPNKWGFGVILNGAELSKYYDIEPYNHANHKLPTLSISKIVKLKPGAVPGTRLIVALGEYGNRIISSSDGADMALYELLMKFLNRNPNYKQTAKTLKNSYVSKKDPTKWSKHPFGNSSNSRWCDTRFTHLNVDQIEDLYVWSTPYSENAIPIQEIRQFSAQAYDSLIRIFKEYSSFDEKEERIWVENNLVNFIQIPKSALAGIILPNFYKTDYYAEHPENNHIAWFKQFVKDNNIRVEWHEFSAPIYYKKDFESNDTLEKETNWSNIDRITNDPKVILNRAERAKGRIMRNIETPKGILPPEPAIVATAAVKLAISEYMIDLTPENYTAKYDEALATAKAYYSKTLVKGKLTPVPNRQIEELFDYYCPDPPSDEQVND
jgi:ADP-ribose pyrophosphatase YjhB (NUDIX family)